VYFNDISAVLYFRYVRENVRLVFSLSLNWETTHDWLLSSLRCCSGRQGKEFRFHFFKEFEAACKNK
jgi:hypothetical protein